MGRLTHAELLGRLALDYRAAKGLVGGAVGAVRAYDSDDSRRARREATEVAALRGAAALYVVEYAFPYLVGLGRTASRASAAFDLRANGNFPYTKPVVTFLSRPVPWSPHVSPTTGVVCLGDGWELARGSILLAHLIVHVARIMNLDEPDHPDLDGYNVEALRHWRETMRCRPYLPSLVYPALPSDVTHGVDDPEETSFRPAEQDLFVPVSPEQAAFRRARW